MAFSREPVVVGGVELQPVSTATTVRVRDGETLGPRRQGGGVVKYVALLTNTSEDRDRWEAMTAGAEDGTVPETA